MNDGLNDVLRKWKGIEPHPDFGTRVWNAIHSAETAVSLDLTQHRWRLTPLIAAASLVLAVGVGLLVATASRPIVSPFAGHFALARPGSITGNYALLAQGDRP